VCRGGACPVSTCSEHHAFAGRRPTHRAGDLLGHRRVAARRHHGLPLGWALTSAKADEREACDQIVANTPSLARARPFRQVTLADKNHYGRTFDACLDAPGIDILPPARKGEHPGPDNASSNRYAKSSSRSTTPSKANSTSSATVARPSPESAPGLPNASSALTAEIWHNMQPSRAALPRWRAIAVVAHKPATATRDAV
jgi:hypothetical protein